ncbi:MAG: hypothetical protein ABI690_05065 [Chloroflexota bacterium]
MAKWKIQHTDDEATQEILTFFAQENVKDEIKRILKILASQDDPRRPVKQSGLIVNRIEHDAPTWYRVKVPRYAIRIIFRLLIVRNGAVIELAVDETTANEDECYIDITRMGRHPTVYGKALRERYKKINN